MTGPHGTSSTDITVVDHCDHINPAVCQSFCVAVVVLIYAHYQHC